jgi:hypothetical protein
MRLRLERTWCGPVCTIGTLYVDGKAECFTCEDVTRPNGEKVYGETAIPSGVYNVVVTPSNRFKRDLPLVENVPGFQGIRIHPGNTAADTDGCILVGKGKMPDGVSHSREAFDALFRKIKESLGAGEKVTLEVTK